jgi:pimeloyl-ACP methyl ester carboxylesterase
MQSHRRLPTPLTRPRVPAKTVVFVHGAGRAGDKAWPAQRHLGSEFRLEFIERVGYRAKEDSLPTDFSGDVARVLAALGDGGHIVAHSYGAIAAIMAAQERPDAVTSLVLFEPASMSLARGGPLVEAHVAALSPVLEQAAESTDLEFEAAFMMALRAPATTERVTKEARLRARRLRLQTAPWHAPLNWAGLSLPPTLVVTGGWSALYDEVAQVFAAHGAQRATLAGAGHRPQDAAGANEFMVDFWNSLSA